MDKNRAIIFVNEVNNVRAMVDRKGRSDIIFSAIFTPVSGAAARCKALWDVDYYVTGDSDEDRVLAWLEAHEIEADALAHCFGVTSSS